VTSDPERPPGVGAGGAVPAGAPDRLGQCQQQDHQEVPSGGRPPSRSPSSPWIRTLNVVQVSG